MERIISHIEYLLDHHECIVIPGLGAFIKCYEPARIDVARGIITAPRSSITFNCEIRHDDGLLASSYARSMSVPYTTAAATLSEDVMILKSLLNNNGTARVGDIGTLNTDSEGLLVFEPTDSTYTNSGLRDIKAKTETEADNVVNTTVLESPERYDNTFRRVMRYAAMLVILLGVGIVLSTPLTTPDRENVVKASICPIEITTAIEIPAYGSYPEFLIAEPHTESTEPEMPRDKYCLVIASLANYEQAQQFISQAGNDASGLFESNGRYRVYAKTGASVADVTDTRLEEKYPGAWPCAMPTE